MTLVINGLLWVSVALIVLSAVFGFIRLLRGPSRPDRVVALDLFSLLTICGTGIAAIATGQSAFLDLALAVALIAFLGTIALARYAERRRERETVHAEDLATSLAQTAWDDQADAAKGPHGTAASGPVEEGSR